MNNRLHLKPSVIISSFWTTPSSSTFLAIFKNFYANQHFFSKASLTLERSCGLVHFSYEPSRMNVHGRIYMDFLLLNSTIFAFVYFLNPWNHHIDSWYKFITSSLYFYFDTNLHLVTDSWVDFILQPCNRAFKSIRFKPHCPLISSVSQLIFLWNVQHYF